MEPRDHRSQGDASRHQDAWWSTLGAIYNKRLLIIGLTILVAISSVGISLILPVWYESTARVILPKKASGGGLSALIGNLDPAAASLLGGVGGDYIRYLAILHSNTMRDRIIDEFDLMTVYETGESQTPVRDTRDMLASNLTMEIDVEYDYLSISALDQDPVRATEMANFIVEELNRMNIRLSTESAGSYRSFVERRYTETIAGMDSAMAELERYQQEHGLIELEAQSQAFLQLLASYRAATFAAEVEYEGLVLDFGKGQPPYPICSQPGYGSARKGAISDGGARSNHARFLR